MLKGKFKWLKIVGLIIGILVLTVAGTIFILNESIPEGQEGPEAEAMARKLEEAINQKAWNSTGAVSWNFADRHQFIWDRERHFTQVTWGDHKVLLDINNKTGIAYKNGQKIEGDTKNKLIYDAWAYWANDSFWLNAPAKVFDPGTTRKLVKTDEGDALMISYSSGGVTPGDTYLWFLDETGLPKYYKMWVSIIPVGGMKATWEDWKTQPNGSKIATLHDLGMFKIEIKDLKTAASLSELTENEDIFKEL